ncbi:MAG: alcohol dehydrogenase [Aeriscardovia sp.]|nr:alcohol dehydrogenase [Aeriscardovia sp.]
MISDQHTHASVMTVIRKLVAVILCAACVGFIGTALHRSGADSNLPWGLFLAYGLVVLSTLYAKWNFGTLGVGLHLISCSGVVWFLATTTGGNGSILIPIGSPAFTTFFSAYDGYFWILGVVLLQLVLLMTPHGKKQKREAYDVQESVSTHESESTV